MAVVMALTSTFGHRPVTDSPVSGGWRARHHLHRGFVPLKWGSFRATCAGRESGRACHPSTWLAGCALCR